MKYFKKCFSILFIVSIVSGCSFKTFPHPNKFFYTYDFNLFEKSEENKEGTRRGITQYFCYQMVKGDKVNYDKFQISYIPGKSIIGDLKYGPDIDPDTWGFPLYTITGIYKDKEFKQKFTEEEILHFNVEEGSDLEIYVYATTHSFWDDDFYSSFYSGKYLNVFGLEFVIDYPNFKISYLDYIGVGKFNGGLSIDVSSVKFNGNTIDDIYKNVGGYGDTFMFYDQPKNHICYTIYPSITDIFIDYFNIEIPEEETIDYTFLRTPFKGLDYSEYY